MSIIWSRLKSIGVSTSSSRIPVQSTWAVCCARIRRRIVLYDEGFAKRFAESSKAERMNNQGRDRSIEKLLRSHGGDDIASSMSRECLDPETLAAWMDGELRGAVRVAAERHAAGCNRCQALLATMARTVPEVEPAPWRKVSAKWLVPIAFVATALVMWVSVERTRFNPVSSATPQTIASRDELSTVPAGPQSGPALPSQAPN